MKKNGVKAKKVVIHHPCNLTRCGLEWVLSDSDLFGQVEIISSMGHLPDCLCAWNLFDIDVMVMTASINVYGFMSGMKRILEVISKLDPKTKIIICTHSFHIQMVRRYMLGVNRTHVVLDIASSVNETRDNFKKVFKSPTDFYENMPVSWGRLSSRELTVLNSLLEGSSMKEIALALNLNYKTVSHYKRAALMKLGVDSCHPLLMTHSPV